MDVDGTHVLRLSLLKDGDIPFFQAKPLAFGLFIQFRTGERTTVVGLCAS